MTDEARPFTLDMLLKARDILHNNQLSNEAINEKMICSVLTNLKESWDELAQVRAEMRKEIFIRDNEISHLKAQLAKLL